MLQIFVLATQFSAPSQHSTSYVTQTGQMKDVQKVLVTLDNAITAVGRACSCEADEISYRSYNRKKDNYPNREISCIK